MKIKQKIKGPSIFFFFENQELLDQQNLNSFKVNVCSKRGDHVNLLDQTLTFINFNYIIIHFFYFAKFKLT